MEPPPPYFPPPESAGGWLATDDQPAAEAGVDAASLRQTFELQDFLFGGQNWACVVIRKGQLVAEHGSFMGLPTSRFDIWSCTKSFTGAAWGMLLEDSRAGRLPGGCRAATRSRSTAWRMTSCPRLSRSPARARPASRSATCSR
jgi:hypothetical protein